MSVALVTGASSGIGKAIYEYLKGEKYDVVGVSKGGPDIRIDLSNDSDVWGLETRVNDEVDLLINCAGILNLDESVLDVNRHLFEVNFWAPYRLIKMFEHDLLNCGGGLIINIASVSGMMADPDTPIYGASKAALISLTKSLAVKYAPRIRVNTISPGFFNTNLVPEPTPKALIDPVPLGYEEEPEMILPVVQMLLDCPYITGANIVVDGGLSCKVK